MCRIALLRVNERTESKTAAAAILLIWLISLPCNGLVYAQAHTDPRHQNEIVVGTRAVAPFVMKTDEGELTGFSIDLWHAIAAELGSRTRFELHETLPDLLEAVRTGKQPLGISAVSITAERSAALDFSQPMFRAGLGIMVRTADEKIDVAGILFSKTTLMMLCGLTLVILVPAHIFWWIARGRDEGLPIREPYIPGIFDAIFWCAESMGGAPQGYPKQHFPRIVALVWLYTGILLVSYFTAYATTSLTLTTLRGHINGPSDLVSKRVAVVTGSTGAEYIAQAKAVPVAHLDLAGCATALLNRSVDAVVYDAPMIQHYALKEGRAQMVGHPFHTENYGIIFPMGSPKRRIVDEALLKLQENGTYDALIKKWTGISDKR